jgi:hypothetical protein
VLKREKEKKETNRTGKKQIIKIIICTNMWGNSLKLQITYYKQILHASVFSLYLVAMASLMFPLSPEILYMNQPN